MDIGSNAYNSVIIELEIAKFMTAQNVSCFGYGRQFPKGLLTVLKDNFFSLMIIQVERFLGYVKDVGKADTELMKSDHPVVCEAIVYYWKSACGALLRSCQNTT